jgi:hypothetical protein
VILPFLLKYIGAVMIKKIVIRWAIGFIFDAFISIAENLARRSDTDFDDKKVAEFKADREKFIKFAKGLL